MAGTKANSAICLKDLFKKSGMDANILCFDALSYFSVL